MDVVTSMQIPTALTLSHHSDFIYSMHDTDQNVSSMHFLCLANTMQVRTEWFKLQQHQCM